MSLKDLVPKGVSLDTPEGSLELSPLTLEDFAFLVRDHGQDIEQLMSGAIDTAEIIGKSPEFAATIIALSAGEPDGAEYARHLPIGVQTKALTEIWKISAMDAETLGTFMAGLLSGLNATVGGVEGGMKLLHPSGNHSTAQDTETPENTH